MGLLRKILIFAVLTAGLIALGRLAGRFLPRGASAGRPAAPADAADSLRDSTNALPAVEADRAKPRATARWVTLISAGVLVILAISGSYVAPYKSPFGQVILISLLSAYVATLVWMKRMASWV